MPVVEQQGITAYLPPATLTVMLPRPEAEAHAVNLRRSFSEIMSRSSPPRKRERRATSSSFYDTEPCRNNYADYATLLLPRSSSPSLNSSTSGLDRFGMAGRHSPGSTRVSLYLLQCNTISISLCPNLSNCRVSDLIESPEYDLFPCRCRL